MEDLKDILLDGEQIVWSGRPSWTREKSRFAYLRGKLIAGGVAILFTGAGIVGLNAGAGGVSVVAFVFAVFAALVVFSTTAAGSRRRDLQYALTDRRLIVSRESPEERVSIGLKSITAINLQKNGKVRDLTLRTGDGEADYVTLYALEDAGDAERFFAHALGRG